MLIEMSEAIRIAKENENSDHVVCHMELEGTHFALVTFKQLAVLKGDIPAKERGDNVK